MKESIKNWL